MNPQLFVLKAALVNNGEGLFFFLLFFFSEGRSSGGGSGTGEKGEKSIMSRLEAGLTQRFSCLISSGRQSN